MLWKILQLFCFTCISRNLICIKQMTSNCSPKLLNKMTKLCQIPWTVQRQRKQKQKQNLNLTPVQLCSYWKKVIFCCVGLGKNQKHWRCMHAYNHLKIQHDGADALFNATQHHTRLIWLGPGRLRRQYLYFQNSKNSETKSLESEWEIFVYTHVCNFYNEYTGCEITLTVPPC